jgi:hypothetical protein
MAAVTRKLFNSTLFINFRHLDTMYEHISKEQDRFRIQEFMGHGKILMFTSFPEYVISVGGDWMYAIIMIFYLSLAFITVLSVVSFSFEFIRVVKVFR